ncbi:MAG TPA: hypothetical protein VEL51_17750 [Vicinamibacterales bacterium]|nr:hypothetical protein [Vicinamibacterales bacterium]
MSPRPPLHISAPRIVATLPPDVITGSPVPDFSKLLASVPAERNAIVPLTIVTNWTEMLRKR